MATHMTLRLAWHNDGWNGRICKKPEYNTYCVGCSSYPGELIRERRNLEWEKKNAGKLITELDDTPPCMYSANAFSDTPTEVYADPPEFFRDETKRRYWELPESTACTWPYEAMYYMPDVKGKEGFYDYEKRLKYEEDYFAELEQGKSLVFYYANYSNPVSTDENSVYLLVGVARIKKIGPTLYYDGCSERTLDRYKGFVWQRSISSDYPEQGVRLPYHRYLDDPDTLNKFAVVPENSRLCKYATKHVSDDDALGLLEQLLESARIVRDDVQDDSENWDQRIEWLEKVVGELWESRGGYPGMPAVLDVIGLAESISGFRAAVEAGREAEAVKDIRQFVASKSDDLLGFYPDDVSKVRRTIKLNLEGSENLLLNVLPRIAVTANQVKMILGEDRESVGIAASLEDIEQNPYLLAEQYVGTEPGDRIRWSSIDRGMLPSPELGAEQRFEKDAPERLRTLLLETLRSNAQQTFLHASELLQQVNSRIKAQPEWKENLLTEKYLKVDKEFYECALHFREEGGELYIYDKLVWDDERFVQTVIDDRLTASDIQLPRPVGEAFWHKVLYNENSQLASKTKTEYAAAVKSQEDACERIQNKRFAAITGGAGTGKTTVVAALIRAVKKIHGEGTGVAVLAPTGKATDRLRASLKKVRIDSAHTVTVHSLLARHGWLNSNMTFRRKKGKPVQDYSTIIIDECSMIDLTLMAALFRAIDWDCVRQLILVGDAAQLPPIGIGKAYAEIVDYLRKEYPTHLVNLRYNLRQLENRVIGRGNGILTLAGCYINAAVRGHEDESPEESIEREELIRKLHEGGDIDNDLSVMYWSDPEALQKIVIDRITEDLGGANSEDVARQLWSDALKEDINAIQILSPVRGELYGTESINLTIQDFKSRGWIEKKGALDSITLFDKVIQIVNRPTSRPLKGYSFDTRAKESVEVFNGEIGTVVPTGNWSAVLRSPKRIENFSVQFSGKKNISVNYGPGRDSPESNLELAYALSVHKSQGSEFSRVYIILPKGRISAQTMELIYTAITRASLHCTVFAQDSVETLLDPTRPEQSALKLINSSLFEFNVVHPLIRNRNEWYEAGKIHRALTGDMVRSKSELVIANMLHERNVTFWYEKPLRAPDGTLYLPDFTIKYLGEEYYWEHLGMLDKPEYEDHWEKKEAWYEKHFPGRLVTTREGSELSDEADKAIERIVGKS